jgi:hypothetical protein
VSSVTLTVFQIYLEHLTYFWNVSSLTWNATSVIWDAFSVHTTHVPVKKGELECVWCSMLRNFKGPLKIRGEFNICLLSLVKCTNQGLLIDITSSI